MKRRAESGAVWCITHQVVIEAIARHTGVPVPDDLDFLAHIVVQQR